MSVKIEASDSMLPSLDSLKTTALPMHKLYFELSDVDTWYSIMREARAQFGKNWRSQAHVKRRLEHAGIWRLGNPAERVWFEVPDPKFGTWIAIKHAVRQVEFTGK
jgi:hypothetical protein